MKRAGALVYLVFLLGQAAVAQWSRVDPCIQGRVYHAMTYDSGRQVAVLFGGIGGGRETWEWDGNGWALASMSGPIQRENTALAHDSVREETVLFGGWTQDGGEIRIVNDTWTWDGVRWEQKQVQGPPARWGAAMTFDSGRGIAVLFGGVNFSNAKPYYSDLWEWNGSSWRKVTVVGPKPQGRRYGCLVYDERRGKIVLFGGEAGGPDLTDTWEYDGLKWKKIAAAGPESVHDPVMVYDAGRRKSLLAFYTYNSKGKRIIQVWTWGGTAWKKISSFLPPGRFPSDWKAAYDAARNQTIFFSSPSATWVFRGTAWVEKKLDWQFPPAPDSMTYDSGGGKVLMFRNGTWAWDGYRWYELSKTQLNHRFGTAMAYDAARGVSVLFGGVFMSGGVIYYGDTWTWDRTASAWTRVASTGPPARYMHAMAYDAERSETVLFGGLSSGTAGSDPGTWTWNGTAWTQKSSAGPAVRSGHAMAYDSDRGVVYLFGGESSVDRQTTFGDLWEWDGTSWTQVEATGPAPRTECGLAYDPIRGKLVLFGGRSFDAAAGKTVWMNDLWEYDGSWTKVDVSCPAPRSGHKMVFNESMGIVFMAGGLGDLLGNETWTYGPRRPLVAASADYDGDGKSDIAIYDYSSGQWSIRGGTSFSFGTSGDCPAPGDYDGDGLAEAAYFRPSEGLWQIRGGGTIRKYGSIQDIPVPGDYNGDGRTEIAFFRPKTGEWFIRGQGRIPFGQAGDVPVPADYDGDRKTDIAIFRPKSGQWLLFSGAVYTLGAFEDIPVPGDYNGDGKAEPAVFRPSERKWMIFHGGQFTYGLTGDIPVPGHYKGPGRAVLAMFRPATGEWLIKGMNPLVFGKPGVIPLCRGN